MQPYSTGRATRPPGVSEERGPEVGARATARVEPTGVHIDRA
ncbi:MULTISPECIES: hypothetical protein [unclassified Streptomyces]|nr:MULTISPECIES: hypothetical protein [unclassified Streptomyces]